MPIVSFAQNFEDVMLWRSLKDITNGFYIDIGANDPLIDSVTNLFYLNGWSGINIEPLKKHYDALVENRERDINLNCAISNCTSELDIWESDIRGWATLDKSVVEQHELNGFKGVWRKTPVKTLKQTIEESLPANITDIHFLKIDVEGVEEQVVMSNDWSKYRPWILVIESTAPNSQNESHTSWEEILLANDYIFSYFDGLNRFYISKEHEELLPNFKNPPNVFDEFITYAEHLNKEVIAELQDNLQVMNDEVSSLNELLVDKNEELRIFLDENMILKNKLSEVYSSHSWKLTSPFRRVSAFLRRK
ncbi:FkbM family methyltransferase [Pantoea sp. B270]|uniref:FkbM family methyltransferase n=1 Tax=unclassified Pantoea TaxID=2630326 RepID=UPI000B507A50|nr:MULTISPECIES: FkbM family methyltransferase [unclassified Pantoea]MBU6517953.1 FkbM family methyltransferase [Pantoea sp. B270]NIG36544.1 FkbM family methyltransferase [Pantoea sp. Ap-959]OWS75708.1 hypothetical protein CBW22_10265 [Pantoea sp. VS1]PPC65152.1 FkbM family methyltransferase [Pantoea sp. ICBG 828]